MTLIRYRNVPNRRKELSYTTPAVFFEGHNINNIFIVDASL